MLKHKNLITINQLTVTFNGALTTTAQFWTNVHSEDTSQRSVLAPKTDGNFGFSQSIRVPIAKLDQIETANVAGKTESVAIKCMDIIFVKQM